MLVKRVDYHAWVRCGHQVRFHQRTFALSFAPKNRDDSGRAVNSFDGYSFFSSAGFFLSKNFCFITGP